jgi:hypothetical protein
MRSSGDLACGLAWDLCGGAAAADELRRRHWFAEVATAIFFGS